MPLPIKRRGRKNFPSPVRVLLVQSIATMAPACCNVCLSISAFVSSRAEAHGKIGTRCVKYCHKCAPPSPRFNCNLVNYVQSKPSCGTERFKGSEIPLCRHDVLKLWAEDEAER